MPYSISDLPSRAGPSLDRARILPLPPLRPLPVKESGDGGDDVDDDENEEGGGQTSSEQYSQREEDPGERGTSPPHDNVLNTPQATIPVPTSVLLTPQPSLLSSALRSARKLMIIRREDGYEKRRVYRCARCGLTVGYEIIGDADSEAKDSNASKDVEKERDKTLYLLEGGLIETERLGVEPDGG